MFEYNMFGGFFFVFDVFMLYFGFLYMLFFGWFCNFGILNWFVIFEDCV